MTKQTRKRNHSAKKKYRKQNRNLKTRRKDIDQVHEDIINKFIAPCDEELPGGGEYYCISCARYFISQQVLQEHLKTKPHKRKLKEALKNPYTAKDSELAAEMTPES